MRLNEMTMNIEMKLKSLLINEIIDIEELIPGHTQWVQIHLKYASKIFLPA